MDLRQQVLRTDISGMPLEWIDYQQAARLLFQDEVAYVLGSDLYTLHGGICAATGQRTVIEVNSILATRGDASALTKMRENYIPPLNNRALFKRDAFLCMYCGNHFRADQLSRDHIRPLSCGGRDKWKNVVTACKRCNNHKAGRTPEQAGMQLLAIPFAPTYAEYIFLKGRRILSDQMEFLRSHFPRSSPIHARIRRGTTRGIDLCSEVA
jgi:5-methylcytosine-specific restriction endonuclease McrA